MKKKAPLKQADQENKPSDTVDIDMRKESEDEQKKTNALYRRIVETSQEGIWTIDEHDQTNFVNKKICDILGYSQREMLGKKPYDFLNEEDRDAAIARIKNRYASTKADFDARFIAKSGLNVWVRISASPIFNDKGVYKGSLAMLTDISQRKMDEEALKKSEANLRTVFDNTDSSYILISAGFNIVSFNALAQKYSEEQNSKTLEAGLPIKQYFNEARWPFILETLDRVSRGETVKYELSYKHSDGTVKWHEISWLNVKNNENKNWGFILANKDITESKIAALEREKITSDLIQHNQDLEQFTYIISHNLRAPVANIIGLADMLKEQDVDVTQKMEILDRVTLSIKNIDTVIKDLNHILQAREVVNEKKETINFNELLGAISTSIQHIISSENVQFKCTFDEVDHLFTIRSYLYSIFYNLTSNSIKYRRPGVAPVISITSHQLKDKIELCFKDNGKGIDTNKNAEQLFGLYKRFDTSMEGKGMGLFMVKTQVEALGGSIKIKSKLGEGTEFTIQLPV